MVHRSIALKIITLIVALASVQHGGVDGFSVAPAFNDGSPQSAIRNPSQLLQASGQFNEVESASSNNQCRRGNLKVLATSLGSLFLGTNTLVANAAMENSQKVFKVGEKLGVEASKARFLEAQQSLNYLVENYDEVAKGGGDNVRRYLGTVGTTSGMYGISKVLKGLQEEASDMVTYTETMLDFDYSLQAADTAVYSANFVQFSSASTSPEKFFDDAKRETKNMRKYLIVLASELNL